MAKPMTIAEYKESLGSKPVTTKEEEFKFTKSKYVFT